MRSTPINIVLSEAGELPLDIRRNWLAIRFLIKAFSIQDNPAVEYLTANYVNYNYNINFWSKYSIPPLLEAFDLLQPLINQIDVRETIPYFETPPIFQEINFSQLNLQKNTDNSRRFLIESQTKFPNKIFIFTDASKGENKTVGIGVYGPQNIRVSLRLPNNCTICTAEVYAIGKALEIIDLLHLTDVVIFSDSLSALQKIANFMKPSDDHLTLSTKRKVIELNRNGNNVELVWIPSHTKIFGNDQADSLANEGRGGEFPIELHLNYSEFLPGLKQQFWEVWIERWKQISETKGKIYGQLIQVPYKKLWFKSYGDLSRKEIVTFCRIRSGHCSSPEHLNRIGVKPDPLCECGEIGSIIHLLFECPRFVHHSDILYHTIQQIYKNTPLNISNIILASPKIIKPLVNFLKVCQLSL